MNDPRNPTSDPTWNFCEWVRQAHSFDLHYQMGTGLYTEKCQNCGLTPAEVRARRNDGGVSS